MHQSLILFVLVTERSNSKSTVEDLNGALEKNERLDKLSKTIDTGVIYRLALASNTKG